MRWGAGLVVLVAAACSDAGPETTLEIVPPATTEVVVGDFLTLSLVTTGGSVVPTWRSTDLEVAVVEGGVVEARRPGPVTIRVSADGAVGDEIALTVVERPGGYAAEEIDYFAEIAFGAEFGGASPLLRRWRTGSGPLVRVNGSPTSGDREVLDSVVAEINRLAPVDIEIVADFPTVEMHFVPQAQFQDILPQAPPGNNGVVWLWWDGTNHLVQSVVLIATDQPETLRAHIIREEVTQMLGLLRDSFRYPESIFFQGFSEVTEYLPIDRVVIELAYRPELSVGMDAFEAAQVARTLLRGAPPAVVAGAPPPTWGDRAIAAGWGGPPPAWRAPERGTPGSAGGSSGRRGPATD